MKFVSLLALALPATTISQRLFFLGDWGGTEQPPFTTKIQRNVARSMLQYQNNHKSSVFALGDNFYHWGVKDDHSKRFWNTWQQVYKPKPEIPWYVLAGNHDYYGNVTAELDYVETSQWNFPGKFYTVKQTFDNNFTVVSILIDTVELCGLVSKDAQTGFNPSFKRLLRYDKNSGLENVGDAKDHASKRWSWLETELLKNEGADVLLVLGHYPTWSIAKHGPSKCLVEKLPKLMEKFQVSAYISGHDHNLQLIKKNGLLFATSGAGAYVDKSTRNMDKVGRDNVMFYNNDPGDNGGFIFFDVKTRNLVFVDGNAKIKHQHRLKMRNSVNISSPRNFSSNNNINFRKKYLNRLAYNAKITDTNRDTSSRNSFTKLKNDNE